MMQALREGKVFWAFAPQSLFQVPASPEVRAQSTNANTSEGKSYLKERTHSRVTVDNPMWMDAFHEWARVAR